MLPIPYDKRSVDDHNEIHTFPDPASPRVPDTYIETLLGNDVEIPVSYTHLTLPTILLV